jgi:hypothetical protein
MRHENSTVGQARVVYAFDTSAALIELATSKLKQFSTGFASQCENFLQAM